MSDIQITLIIIAGLAVFTACCLCYNWGYRDGKMPCGLPDLKFIPQSPGGYQPANDIRSSPPSGGSGVPDKPSKNSYT